MAIGNTHILFMQYSIKTCYALSKYCNDPNVVNCSNIVNDPNVLNDHNIVNSPNVVNDHNIVPVASHWQTWSHNVVSTTPRHKLLAVPYNVHP
jgi:hypothetical protein